MSEARNGLKLSISKDGSIAFEVRAKPNAKKSAIAGVREGALEVKVAAPPVDDAFDPRRGAMDEVNIQTGNAQR